MNTETPLTISQRLRVAARRFGRSAKSGTEHQVLEAWEVFEDELRRVEKMREALCWIVANTHGAAYEGELRITMNVAASEFNQRMTPLFLGGPVTTPEEKERDR